jgi:hypothetical protein
VKKLENTTSAPGCDRENETRLAGELSTPATSTNIVSRAWARVCSWFEAPYGYEDAAGFHYGEEPVTCRSDANALREVFTDHACDTAIFMAEKSTETSPAPAPEQPANAKRESHEWTVNPS